MQARARPARAAAAHLGGSARRSGVPARSSSTDTGAPPADAFAELVRLAVEKDPSLATLAEQQLKQRQQPPAAAAPARPAPPTAMLGPSLASLPNSSKPPWLRQRAPQGEKYGQLFSQMRELKLATVCEEAQCPNIGECWNGDMGAVPRDGRLQQQLARAWSACMLRAGWGEGGQLMGAARAVLASTPGRRG